MSTPTEGFQKASFDGNAFPVSKISVKGASRKHVHEFPHSPGGEIEKMGRKLYEIRLTAHFHQIAHSFLDEQYPNLYPKTLSTLRGLFEEEKTASLIVPNIGTIQAYCTDWDQTFDFTRAMSGEETEFVFLEDQDRDQLLDLSDFGTGLEEKMYTLVGFLGTTFPKPPSIFQQLNDLVTALGAIQGVTDVALKLIEAKLLAIANICQQIDQLDEMQVAESFKVLQAMKEVWMAAISMASDIEQRRSPIQTYTVPRLMSAAQVSMNIFGTAERAMEILNLNPIDDAFAIPAGTVVRFYQES